MLVACDLLLSGCRSPGSGSQDPAALQQYAERFLKTQTSRPTGQGVDPGQAAARCAAGLRRTRCIPACRQSQHGQGHGRRALPGALAVDGLPVCADTRGRLVCRHPATAARQPHPEPPTTSPCARAIWAICPPTSSPTSTTCWATVPFPAWPQTRPCAMRMVRAPARRAAGPDHPGGAEWAGVLGTKRRSGAGQCQPWRPGAGQDPLRPGGQRHRPGWPAGHRCILILVQGFRNLVELPIPVLEMIRVIPFSTRPDTGSCHEN